MWIKNSFAFLQVTFNDSGRTIDSYKALIRRPFNAKATVLYSDCVFKNFFTLPGIDIWYFSDPGRNPGIILNNNGQNFKFILSHEEAIYDILMIQAVT